MLAYVSSQSGDPRVSWTSGRPPGASVPPERAEVQRAAGSAPWPVEIGLSEPAAAALHVARRRPPRRRRRAAPARRRAGHGVYRVADPQDPAWQPVPTLRTPSTVAGSAGTSFVTVAGLLSRDSLPDARIALDEDEVTRHVGYEVEPTRVTAADAGAVAAAAVRLQGAAGSGGAASVLPAGTRWDTGLVAVLRRGQGDVEAALAQAATLLGGLVAAAGAGARARCRPAGAAPGPGPRRSPRARGGSGRHRAGAGRRVHRGSPGGSRRRGARGAGVRRERRVGVAAARARRRPGGVARCRRARGGAGSPLPPVAPRTGPARRSLLRTRRLRRATLEVAVALLAVAAFVALRQRGAGSGGDVLPAVAPVLGALTGALLLRRPRATGGAARGPARGPLPPGPAARRGRPRGEPGGGRARPSSRSRSAPRSSCSPARWWRPRTRDGRRWQPSPWAPTYA